MEFWGVEVHPKKPLRCDPGDDSYFHISQAALGEAKEKMSNERVVLKVTVGNIEYVVGTLSQGKCDQTSLDLIFDKEFSLSHNSASCSVYFCGYKTEAAKDQFDKSSDEEDIPESALTPMKTNGKTNPRSLSDKDKVLAKETKAIITEKPIAKGTPAAKEKADLAENKSVPSRVKLGPKIEKKVDEDFDDEDEVDEDEDEEGDDDDDEDDDDDDDEDEDDEMDELESDEEDSDGKESEEEHFKAAAAKKRLMIKSIDGTSSKKTKLDMPLQGKGSGAKTESKPLATSASITKTQLPRKNMKTGAFVKKTTPQENVSPLQRAEGAKSNIPSSGKKIGSFVCKTCDRNFVSESALSQHQSAKHSK